MEDPFKKENKAEAEPKLAGVFKLGDFRAGHWPGTKTPPWWFNGLYFMEHPEWYERVKKMDWDGVTERKVGGGVIETKNQPKFGLSVSNESHEIDVYAYSSRREKGHFEFAAYPKGTSYGDYWDEDGSPKQEEE